MSGARCARGFTLLEVAIALAILGVGVVTVLEILSASLRMEAASGVRTRAVVLARTLLDDTMTTAEVVVGQEAGRYDETYRWERAVREAPEQTDSSGREFEIRSDVTIYEIEVSVLWPQTADREGVYTVRTLRVGPSPLT